MQKEIISLLNEALFKNFILFKEENKLLNKLSSLIATLDLVTGIDYIQYSINYI